MKDQPQAELREVVRCSSCGCNQYRAVSGECRRCQRRLSLAATMGVEATPRVVAASEGGGGTLTAPETACGQDSANPKSINPGVLVSSRLRILRKALGLSQGQFAKLYGDSFHSHISRIENGRVFPGVSLLLRIARNMKIPCAYFFGPLKSDLDEYILAYFVCLPLHQQDEILRDLRSG